MRFEHLIEINSPLATVQMAVPVFTREQLWRGLMIRVRFPQRFPNGPESCEVMQTGPELVSRVLHFGPHVLHDEVHITPGERLQFTPRAHGESTPIRLTVAIEEPQAGQMVLRFIYEAVAELSQEEALYSGYRHSAWLHHDRDMVGTLRQWLAQGELGAVSH